MAILRKWVTLIHVISVLKNWYMYILNYLQLLKEGTYVFVFRNGIRVEWQTNIADRVEVFDIWVQKRYNPPGFEIRNGDIVVDIGAYKGYFSLLAASSAQGVQVYSFEPAPENFRWLCRNIALNHLEGRIKIFNTGVAGERGKRLLHLSQNSSMDTLYAELLQSGKGLEVEIDCVTLADILVTNRLDRCDFLKMDCEGAEFEFLLNAPGEVLSRVERIALESHPLPPFSLSDLIENLEARGFVVKVYERLGYLYARNTNRLKMGK